MRVLTSFGSVHVHSCSSVDSQVNQTRLSSGIVLLASPNFMFLKYESAPMRCVLA